MSVRPFHLAIPVSNLDNARRFFGDTLGCSQGRSSEQWIDWDFFGHQLVTHKVAQMPSQPKTNEVDNKHVPVPHFGVVLTMTEWQALADRLTRLNVEFVIAPYIRFRGKVGEQGTFFLYDYCGNALEFKGFVDLDDLFAS